ncbi:MULTISPECIES: HpcH/HpaI aldolase family protein [unclassified Knoellia]|uniref:HpcH/HpaI aldolase family protein n=1 Tax=Knoellia altitudinis TaxID=3404795 RepID=UPI003619BAFB
MGALAAGSSGIWCSVSSPVVVGLLARSAADWVALDAQHGEFDRRALLEVGRTLSADGHSFAVRVARVDAADIGFALDVGASTVVVPLVDTVDDARLAVAAAHYPPTGHRSWGPLAPLWGQEAPGPEQSRTQVAVMVESALALSNVDAIAAVPGVDLLFVGPFDLALSLGTSVDDLLADADGPLSTVRRAAERAGIGVAAFAGTPERARVLGERGYDCLAVTTDTAVVAAGTETLLARS